MIHDKRRGKEFKGLVRLAGWLIWRERKTLLIDWLAG